MARRPAWFRLEGSFADQDGPRADRRASDRGVVAALGLLITPTSLATSNKEPYLIRLIWALLVKGECWLLGGRYVRLFGAVRTPPHAREYLGVGLTVR